MRKLIQTHSTSKYTEQKCENILRASVCDICRWPARGPHVHRELVCNSDLYMNNAGVADEACADLAIDVGTSRLLVRLTATPYVGIGLCVYGTAPVEL